MAIVILLFLILLNGLCAMAEIAIVSSRKSKLQQMADTGDNRAKIALDLANNPNRFLSTIQIVITFIGIFAGAYGSDTIAMPLSKILAMIPFVSLYSDPIALFLVVAVITLLSLLLGELIPKRIALTNPEKIASFVATPTQALSAVCAPLVNVLSHMTDWVLSGFGLKSSVESPITEDEVKMLIREGARAGIFNLAEKDIVERTFRLADKRVDMLMTPRKEIVWLDGEDTDAVVKKKVSDSSFSYLPVCRVKLDKVIGFVRTKELLTHFLETNTFEVYKIMHKPTFVPESMNALKVLELFKKSGIHVAMVVDEYGIITGLISISDILQALVGDLPTLDDSDEKSFVKRVDGSWLVNGLVSIDDFKEHFQLQDLPDEETSFFHTIGGFVMHRLGKIPLVGDTLDTNGVHFEVVDMDSNRVDKLIVKVLKILTKNDKAENTK